MKKRIILFIIPLIGVTFLYIKYIQYKKQKAYLTEVYLDFPFSYQQIYYQVFHRYNATQTLPDKKKFEKLLKNIDSNLFAKDKFKLQIDTSNNYILLYSYYPAGKDVHLKNYLDMFQFYDRDKSELDKFSFINYLMHDYNLLFFNRKINYKLGKHNEDFWYYFTIPKVDQSKRNNPSNLTNKMNSLISKVGLEPCNNYFFVHNDKDFSKAAIYIYDRKRIKRVFPENNIPISKDIENKLYKLIKESFPNSDYIRFSVMLPDTIQTKNPRYR